MDLRASLRFSLRRLLALRDHLLVDLHELVEIDIFERGQ